MIYCLLSLDLSNADDQQRKDFNKDLAENLEWKKLTGVDTVWARTFTYNVLTKAVINDITGTIDSQLITAAKAQGIESLSYVVQVGNNEVVASKIVKPRVGYSYSSTPYNPY